MNDQILPTDSFMDAMIKIADGNPGAANVVAQLVQLDPIKILDADDMGLRGPALWIAYKDYAGEGINKLSEALEARSQNLVNVVNAIPFSDRGEHTAVTHGRAR